VLTKENAIAENHVHANVKGVHYAKRNPEQCENVKHEYFL